MSQSYAYHVGDVDIHLNAGIAQVYDDNISYQDINKVNDYRNDINIGFTADYEKKLYQLNFNTFITRHTYFEKSNFDNTSAVVDIFYNREFSKYDRIKITNKYIHAYEPLILEDEFGNIEGRYRYNRNRFSLFYETEFTSETGANFGYQNEFFSNTHPNIDDSMLNKISFSLNHSLTPYTLIIGGYEFLYRDFNNSSWILTNRPNAGIKHFFTEKTAAILRSGADLSKGSSTKLKTGQFAEISLQNTINERVKVIFSYLKEISSSVYQQDIFDSQKLSISFDTQLLRRLIGSFYAFWGEGEYSESEIKNKLRGVDLGLTYEVSENTNLKLDYSFYNKDSNVDTIDYTKNLIKLGLNLSF